MEGGLMIEYKYPSWYTGVVNYSILIEDDIKKFKDEEKEIKDSNKKLMKEYTEKLKKVKEATVEIFGEYHKATKYMRQQHVPEPIWFSVDRIEERWKTLQKSREETIKEEKRKQNEKEWTEKAIIWLDAKGKKLGRDFKIDEALELANTIAFQEAIEEKNEI